MRARCSSSSLPMVILQSVDRLRVHGAALERRHAAAVGRRGAGHRRADRRLSRLSAGRRPAANPPHRAGAARPGGRFPAAQRYAAAGAEAVLLAARSDAVGGTAQADRPAVLDRHRRQIGAGRNPHPARQHGDARVRAAQRSLRVEFGNLPALDGRHLAGAARRRRSSSCATRSSRSCGWPTPPKASARAARCRISARAARARCGARRRPSSR